MNNYLKTLLVSLILGSLTIVCTGCSAVSYNRAEYIGILKSYPEYKYEHIENIPEFTYAKSSDENLMKLKEAFNLVEVAGNRDEISKIINLMRWVHNIIEYDGNSKNPYPKNTFNIVKICHEENRGVNCRMIATILNEVYLSMGFKSRFVTCMPEKKDFKDSHVINEVYSITLDKWIYMDPTFEAYFRDENGNYLSIREVRERLMSDKPLVLNDEINHNPASSLYRFFFKLGILKFNKDDYVDYMSKNLFRLNSPVCSEFNSETKDKNRSYIELIPRDYNIKSNPEIKTYDGYETITHYTSNPDAFWKKPLDTSFSN